MHDCSTPTEQSLPQDVTMPPTREMTLPVLYFGTPVALISTLNPDGTTNISPMSSAWSLGQTYVLGLGTDGQAVFNLRRHPELVINLASADLVHRVEAIAPTTGRFPVPPQKAASYRHVTDKWTLGGFTPQRSIDVTPDRVLECPVQLEARVVSWMPLEGGDAVAVAGQVVRTHVADDIASTRPNRVDTDRWHPLYYTFRHYFAQGAHVGTNFRAPLLDSPAVDA